MAQTPRRPERITRSDIEQTNRGTSDHNPFVISEVTAQQFRHFLFFIMGTPASPEYCYLFLDNNHTKDAFIDFLGIAVLARHLGMSEIETWACSRLEPIVKSPIHIANSSWDKDTILQAMDSADGFDGKFLGYNACFRFASDMHTVVRLALSPLTLGHPLPLQPPLSSNLDTCVALYKDPNLLQSYPDLFGYVFTIILSLGHRSSVWADQLTREDRAVLYAAQVHLTSLHGDPDLDPHQLLRVLKSYLSADDSSARPYCLEHQGIAWHVSFAKFGTLGSNNSRQDISKIVLLPVYRHIFASSFRASGHCASGYCQGALDKIDAELNKVFIAMYRKYQQFIELA